MVVVQSRVELPVVRCKERIVESVLQHDITLISSETGSGKSTQIPQFLFEARHRFKRQREDSKQQYFRLCITQPRRVAAISLSNRVSSEMGENSSGGTVGYRVRFDEACSDSTSIMFLTDGMLVREAVLDKASFSKYSVVVLDEVHERSLHTDILLGLLTEAVKKRRSTANPLRVVIMSATLTIESFRQFFVQSSISNNYISIPGRAFPVSIWYTQSVEHDYVEASVCTILQVNEDEAKKDGDILVFLPGQDDIEAVSSSLVARKNIKGRELVVIHLYAALSNEAQAAAFSPVPTVSHRKVILATNIAETSLTIPDVRYVIDCGLVKMKSMINAQLEVLRIVPASQAAVTQRTGRAGREAPGQCFRLYREDDFDKLSKQTPPEIVRCELSSALLQISAMGLVGSKCLFPSLSQFPLIDKPHEAGVSRAELLLKRIGAIESATKSVTEYGRKLAAFPLNPQLAHLIMTASETGCAQEAIVLAAMLSVDNLWRSSQGSKSTRGAASASGDHWQLIQVFNQMRNTDSHEDRVTMAKSNSLNPTVYGKTCKIVAQLEKIAKQQIACDPNTSCGSNVEVLARTITKSLWMNVAKLVKKSGVVGHYETIDKIDCFIHPGSSLFGLKEPPECVVFTEIVQTSKNYIRAATAIEGHWLVELVPTYFRARN